MPTKKRGRSDDRERSEHPQSVVHVHVNKLPFRGRRLADQVREVIEEERYGEETDEG